MIVFHPDALAATPTTTPTATSGPEGSRSPQIGVPPIGDSRSASLQIEPLQIGSVRVDPPILQAPMAGFTNYAFRQIVRGFGGTGLQATEMVNARGFVWMDRNEAEHPDRLWGVADEPRPLAVQIWDNDPATLADVGARLAQEYRVSVVDINFGCPVKQVTEKAHSGSYLLRFPDRMGAIIERVVAACRPTPVTAKIRLGCTRGTINAIEVAQVVEGAGAAALTVHGRTAQDFFSGSADWERISAIKPHLRRIPLIGNGDLDSASKVVEAFRRYDVDGVMIARASLGRPWLFAQAAAALRGEPVPPDPSLAEQREIMLRHYDLVVERFGVERGTMLMRKYACCYAQGKYGARLFRAAVANVSTSAEFHEAVERHFPRDKPDGDPLAIQTVEARRTNSFFNSHCEVHLMRWREGRRSENVRDMRGGGGAGGGMPGFGGRRGAGIGGGIGVLVIALVAMYFGANPNDVAQIIGGGQGGGGVQIGLGDGGQPGPVASSPEEDELVEFVSVVLADTEDTWHAQFRAMGKQYVEPKLVLFRDSVSSACGRAGSSVGPFYCPADQQLYIDLAFYEELKTKFKAPGDFAQAYVIAHEVGHHVQNLLGISDQVHEMKGRVSETEYNDLSVRLELQADYFAGVWAHHADRTRGLLEQGDLREAMEAASAVGDDRIQKQARGYAVPDSFTHGTSEQRRRWFLRGYESGDMSEGDTFSAEEL